MKIGFIGGGNMAGALANGVIKSGICQMSDVCICDINEESLKKYDKEIKTSTDNKKALECDYIILASKPYL